MIINGRKKVSPIAAQNEELQQLLSLKKELERLVEHYRSEFKKARQLAREHKRKLKEINIKLKLVEGTR